MLNPFSAISILFLSLSLQDTGTAQSQAEQEVGSTSSATTEFGSKKIQYKKSPKGPSDKKIIDTWNHSDKEWSSDKSWRPNTQKYVLLN